MLTDDLLSLQLGLICLVRIETIKSALVGHDSMVKFRNSGDWLAVLIKSLRSIRNTSFAICWN